MRTFLRMLTCVVALVVWADVSLAQNSWNTPGGSRANGAVTMCLTAQGNAVPCSDATALPTPVTGSFSATLAGFTPGGTFATLTATAASSASTALPAGVVVAFQNTSAVDLSCVLSAGAATATTDKLILRAGATEFFTVGANVNTACINQTGSASNVVVLAGGSGLGTNFGGGGAGGGGGGAVTVADGADVTQGLIADAVVAAGAAGTTSAKLRRLTTDISAILAQLQGVTAGADNVSNTATGELTYSRMQVFDGSTWDRWTGLVQAAQSGTWTMSISQGGNTALVKAANTVGPTDQALVVAVANTLTAMANNADGVAAGTANVSPVGSFPFLWNGATYDRWKSAGSTGVAAVRPTDGTRNAIIDPCEANLQSYATGVITSATTTRIIAPSASNKTYLCMFFTKASAADNVAVVEGTGGTCGTGTAALLGGTITANGLVFGTAGDGVLLQAGGKVSIIQTAGTNVDTCLITSTTGPLIWSSKYVQAP